MRDTNLVNALREHAEWQRGNEWETPITLGDDLVAAADRLANQNTHIAALQQEIENLRGQNRQLMIERNYVMSIIEDAPAADVAPVVHGRWDNSGRYTFPGGGTAVRCTNCGCALTESEYRLNNWNYCPVCGAKMDGNANG